MCEMAIEDVVVDGEPVKPETGGGSATASHAVDPGRILAPELLAAATSLCLLENNFMALH